MSKAVMLSIRPKWAEKIANNEKTIEVRKTRPKMNTPFKCYIYCTLPKYPHEDFIATDYPMPQFYGGGKVIGEFTCDRIYELAPLNHAPDDVEKQACLTREEIVNYLKGAGYGAAQQRKSNRSMEQEGGKWLNTSSGKHYWSVQNTTIITVSLSLRKQ